MSQTQAILRALERRPITAIDAMKLCGSFRLAARIKNLRDDGHNIVTIMVKRNGKKIASYELVKKRTAA
jgi:hypothetical protein